MILYRSSFLILSRSLFLGGRALRLGRCWLSATSKEEGALLWAGAPLCSRSLGAMEGRRCRPWSLPSTAQRRRARAQLGALPFWKVQGLF